LAVSWFVAKEKGVGLNEGRNEGSDALGFWWQVRYFMTYEIHILSKPSKEF
jgi:hypothetical protein